MFLLRIQDRTECVKAQDYIWWGGHCRDKTYTGRGDTTHLDWVKNWGGEGGRDTALILLMWGTIGVRTPHNIERKDKSN